MTDWAIPQQAKLRYTQLFNLHDRSRSGFLSGLQCRDILLQSGLQRNILAEIWNLSDIDGDGQLTREEFILAMHLTNHVRSGQTLPTELAPDLIPPSYRRQRSISTTSVASEGSSVGGTNDDQVSQKSSDLTAATFNSTSVLNSNSFEDKRRENFERGRAELERRRLKIIEQQTSILKEQLFSVKKQVTEAKTKIDSMRTERDTKMGTITTLEAQLKTLQDRKAYLNQEELNLIAIAKDLNLVNPAQAELDHIATQAKQESINQMKRQLEEFIKEKEVKSIELIEINSKLDEYKKELKTLSESVSKTYENYKEKVSHAKSMRAKFVDENKSKTADLDSVWDSEPSFVTPNSQTDTTFMSTNEDPWALNTSNDQPNAAFNTSSVTSDRDFYANSNSSPKLTENLDADGFLDEKLLGQPVQEVKRYRALYAFEARNPDELTINPGDIIVGSEVVTEPGWLSGESNGRSGLFPEAYVESINDQPIETVKTIDQPEEISNQVIDVLSEPPPPSNPPPELASKYRVVYAFEARNPDELSINPGDIITGLEGAHEPGWLMGDLNGQKGLFPEAYVEKLNELVQDQPGSGANYFDSFYYIIPNLKVPLLPLPAHIQIQTAQYTIDEPNQSTTTSVELIPGKTRGELAYLIDELLTTEKDYINDLRLCQSAYTKPLSRSFDVSQIFNNWNDLIIVHESSLIKLSNSSSNNSLLSSYYRHIFETFQSLLNNLVDLYVEFCSKQSDSARRFEAKIVSDVRFRQLVNECERNLAKLLNRHVEECDKEKTARALRNSKLPLTSFLLKPLQRITKYSLLFDRIVKCVEEDGPEELEDQALRLRISAQLICNRVNEACKMKDDYEDNKRKLRWAQTHIKQAHRSDSITEHQLDYTPREFSHEVINFDSKTKFMDDRKLIKAASFIKWKSGKELILFLFNDLILLTQVKKGLSLRVEDVFLSNKAQQSYYRIYRKPIALEDLELHESEKTTSNASRSSWNEQLLLFINFTDKSDGHRFTLMASNAQEKSIWLSELDQRIKDVKLAKLNHHHQQAPQIIKKPRLEQCFGRMFITLKDISHPISSQTNHSLLSKLLQDLILTSRLYITLQAKKSMVIDLIEEKKDLVPISDLYKTAPLVLSDKLASRFRPEVDCTPLTNNEEILVQFKEECTQILLEGKIDDAIPNILEVGLLDDSRFRDTQLLFRRRINVNQLMGVESELISIRGTLEGSTNDQSYKIQPNRPVDLIFRMKSMSPRFIDRKTSRSSNSPDHWLRDLQGESFKLNIRMRFHLQLF